MRKQSFGLGLKHQDYITFSICTPIAVFCIGPHQQIVLKKLIHKPLEKIEVSSAKRLSFEVNLAGKSLIQTKNKKGPKIEQCKSPALF